MGNNILQLAMNKDDLNSQYPFYSLNLNSKTSCGFIFLPVTMVLIFLCLIEILMDQIMLSLHYLDLLEKLFYTSISYITIKWNIKLFMRKLKSCSNILNTLIYIFTNKIYLLKFGKGMGLTYFEK